MNYFSWLVKELAAIKLRKFHVIEPASTELMLELDAKHLPDDVLEFAAAFGCARFFRNRLANGYLLLVHLPPLPPHKGQGLKIGYQINSGDGIILGDESGRWRMRGKSGLRFHEWFRQAYQAAKRICTADELTAALSPAPPFSSRELAIVAARAQFTVRVAEDGNAGTIRFEVTNQAEHSLDQITIRIRNEFGMTGEIRLDTSTVAPKTHAIVESSAYVGMNASNTEILELPLPEPEDRPFYFEFDGQ